MGVLNNGVLSGVRRIAGKFRDLDIDGGLPGAPLGLRLRGALQTGPPATGTWRPGDFAADRSGALWGNVAAGTPGQWATTGVLIPPSGDQTGVEDTLRINKVIQSGQAARLTAGAYYVTNLLIDTYGALVGAGNATILNVVSGTTGYAIALKTPATTAQVTLADFTLQCNDVCGGVQLDNTGFQPETQWVPFDPLHQCRNVFVRAAAGDAWHLDNNARGLAFYNCKQYFASGYGFYLGTGAGAGGAACTDCSFVGCISGQSGSDGFYVGDGSSDNYFAACKAFYSGFTESTGTWGTTQCGFQVIGDWNTFASCNAQQAALHGFYLNGCAYTALSACDADTNSAGTSVTTGCGVYLNGVTFVSVTGCTGSVNSFDPPGSQNYGIGITGTCSNVSLIGNSLTGTNEGVLQTGLVNNGGIVIIDYFQAAIGTPAVLSGQPAAYVIGQTSTPAASQYSAQFYCYDASGTGYGRLAQVTGAGLAVMLQGSAPAATSPVTVASSNAIASLGSLSVPANDPVAGARYKVTAHGTLSIASASTATTYICDLRWGGTGGTFLTSVQSAATGGAGAANSPAFPNTTALSAVAVLIEGEVEFLTTTTCVAWLRMTWRNVATPVTTSPVVAMSSITGAVTVTTSSTESLSLDWTWGTNSASNTITIASSSFERVA